MLTTTGSLPFVAVFWNSSSGVPQASAAGVVAFLGETARPKAGEPGPAGEALTDLALLACDAAGLVARMDAA